MKKVIAVHKWVSGCEIREMVDTQTRQWYYVATVRRWPGFYLPDLSPDNIVTEVRGIRKRLDEGDFSVLHAMQFSRENVVNFPRECGKIRQIRYNQ